MMTLCVMGKYGSAKERARPKSASLTVPSSAMSKLLGLMSRCKIKFSWQNQTARPSMPIQALTSAVP